MMLGGKVGSTFTKKKIQNSKVGIIGIGGVGSWAAEALVRSGLKKIVLVDPDNVFKSKVDLLNKLLIYGSIIIIILVKIHLEIMKN